MHERLIERFVDRRTSVLMRRLRENTTLETEIKKTGEVVVEGHEIGRLDGFTFVADASAAGSEAKTLQGAARSALAGEIDARAIKLTQAPDREFVLSSDGSIRWTGAPVGKLIAGDDVLRPRLRIIADEQLTGASREAVQTRLDLWLVNHIERLLAPLFALAAADDITGIARGVAYQLIESIGVLERQKVAEDVKGLDQPSRANLRKYGVRFGAYHLYMPALLKPAPRSLAAQLWMLKHGGPDDKGLDELQRLASSGRTSIPVDKDTPKPLYRTIGYRVCGERAIRVDILERLADLIRPALAWREGVTGVKPAGAFNGFGFTVTGAMTSLTGASGEDFASILRSLGYRMDKRPKPAEPEPAPTSADAEGTAAPAKIGVALETSAEAAPDAPAADGERAPTLAPDAEPVEDTALEPPAQTSAAETGAPAQSPAEPPPATQSLLPSVEFVGAEATPAPAEAIPAAPAEPEMIEVWRPGRPPGERRPRDAERRGSRRRHHERPATPAEGQPAGEGAPAGTDGQAVAADATPPVEGERKERQGRPRHRRRDRGPRKDADGKSAEGPTVEARSNENKAGEEQRADRPQKQGRPERRPERGERPPRQDRGDRGDRGPRRERDRDRGRGDDNRQARSWSSDQPSRGNKEPDPNSPFAKLLALKEQLQGNKDQS
jgi:ATP-dependent RNA helicase SUPV3L1/SUV3